MPLTFKTNAGQMNICDRRGGAAPGACPQGPPESTAMRVPCSCFDLYYHFFLQKEKVLSAREVQTKCDAGKSRSSKRGQLQSTLQAKWLKSLLKPFSQRSALDFFLWISVRGSHPRHSSGRKVKKPI